MAVSNFQQITKHPLTGEMQLADWLDLGERFYVVRFPDGQRFSETEIDSKFTIPKTRCSAAPVHRNCYAATEF